ncbi:GNAT family N-acetyltransferase [Deinococcus pimensis]|uniref:GNAT family N-acetyltransferase n=1 Tax=Deinococcus pimensis TaxID=309888 RepID=UPI003CCC02C0
MTSAWGGPGRARWGQILARSLCWVCAYHDDRLVGFGNVAWDGGMHASIFDTSVHAAYQRRGVGTALLRRASGARCGCTSTTNRISMPTTRGSASGGPGRVCSVWGSAQAARRGEVVVRGSSRACRACRLVV